MTLHKMAASAGLAIGLATAGWSVAATAGTAAASVAATAGNASLTASRAIPAVSSQDRMFMDQASQINLTEISLGKFMEARATFTADRKLGARYARDHTTAQANLRALASRLRVTLPTTAGASNASTVARIEAQKGRSQDVSFATASVSGHKAAIAVFRKEESAGRNPAVKAYAAKYLPMLQTHLRMAEHVESELRASSPKS
jgi:putative membrane protein